VLTGVLVLTLLAAALATLLVMASPRLPAGTEVAVERVNALLPQTQCAQCGYPGCRPYAAAIVAGATDIDRCPPGGEATRRALARLLDRPTPALAAGLRESPGPVLAVIDESACIGCALCLAPCPVDAIVGASRYVHTVIESRCTGCELCVPACPVDCIALVPRRAPVQAAVHGLAGGTAAPAGP
jgi:electron transport complex protein RnfB